MSPIFSVGTLSMNKPLLVSDSDVLAFGLLKYWGHERWFGDSV